MSFFAGLGAFVGIVVIGAMLLALAIPLLLIWLLIEIVRGASDGGRRRRERYDPAAEALKVRYARGEIGQAEFEAGMRSLGYVKRGG
jgi:uncharacterized membrane protein